MKYKAVYDVLNERRQTTPGFCYHDRSGWRAYPQTYMTMQRPLWIIAEDAATGRRLWITQEGTRFSISIRRIALSTPMDCPTMVVIIVDSTTAIKIRIEVTFWDSSSFNANVR